MGKSNGKPEPEKFRIQGHPEVYDDLVKVLRQASSFGPGAQVYRVNDGTLIAIIPLPGKKLVEID